MGLPTPAVSWNDFGRKATPSGRYGASSLLLDPTLVHFFIEILGLSFIFLKLKPVGSSTSWGTIHCGSYTLNMQ